MMHPDKWKMLHAEYCTGDLSLRQLAEKYGVTYGYLRKKSSVEKWHLDRAGLRAEAAQKVAERVTEKLVDNEVSRITLERTISVTLLENLKIAAENLDPADRAGFRQITSALKDLKDIRGEADDQKIDVDFGDLKEWAE